MTSGQTLKKRLKLKENVEFEKYLLGNKLKPLLQRDAFS